MSRVLNTALSAVLFAVGLSFIATAEAPTSPSADQVLSDLKAGNERFVSGAATHQRQDAARLAETAGGQHPLATVITCSDSRVPPELLFDMGLGDLFTIRVAGNVCDTDEIGTAEYGAEHLGTPLLVVMGHSSCGAVKAVCTHAEVGGSIPALVDNIIPAVERAHAESGLEGDALVPAAVEANVWQSISDMISGSEDVRELMHAGKLTVVGAVYDISTGKVAWLGEHPEEAALLGPGGQLH
jgi:carbonic anhydrase